MQVLATTKWRIFTIVLLVTIWVLPQAATGAHGVSIDGALKYGEDFQHFAYVTPTANKGGRVLLHALGSFDKMNPFTLKGEEPFGLEMLVFDTLAVASLDEPFSEYGLLAENIEIAPDGLSVVYTLNPKATFSDGSPVTAQDVAYSLKTLKGPDVHPFYPYYYKDIEGSEVLDQHTIRFRFRQVNRELPMIACQLPVFSERSFRPETAVLPGSRLDLPAPLGSGPYVVTEVLQGKSITYSRNPDYWAADHPTRRGMFNYDTITVRYYKDQTVAVEAFKAGEFDFMPVNIAKQWARDLSGPAFASGELAKEVFPHHNNAGMQGFLMNTRNPLFQDRRVRQAIGLAFDFEWANETLFFKQYSRTTSFFANSPLAATGVPEGLELSYLEPYRAELPAEVFTTPLAAPTTRGPTGVRGNLRQALGLLGEAGWQVKNGQLLNSAGDHFEFEILLVSPSFARVMAGFVANLEKLGMEVSYRVIDPTLYTERLKSFSFDMIVATYGQSLSPGNEQRNYWHSEAAGRKGSNNYAGIASPVVDNLIDRIIYAENRSQLVAACKALDRVLWYGYYLVPNWYLDGHRIAYRTIFKMPETLPLYYSPTTLLMTWYHR